MKLKHSSAWVGFISRQHADLHTTLRCYSGLVIKEWHHFRVMIWLINLIKREREKDIKCDGGRGNYTFHIKWNIFTNRQAFPVCGCWCVQEFWPDHSQAMDVTAFLPRAAGSSFRSTGCSPLSPWLIASSTLIGRLFYSGERQDGERAGLSWAGISRSFHTTSHRMHIHTVSVWMLKHRHEVSLERTGTAFGLLSSPLCHK